MRLAEKVAIVTGSGSGIGRAIAQVFAKEGAKVVVVDINATGGEETVNSIKSSSGEAMFVKTDITKASEVASLTKTIMEKYGKIDVLTNNAGLLPKPAPVEEIDEDFWDAMFRVNVKGMFLMVKHIVPEMKRSGGGVIINTGSGGAVRPPVNQAEYIASKGAVITLTRALAKELAPDNIRVNCVNPGPTATQRNVAPPANELAAARAAIVNLIPLKRRPKPEDIAYAEVYLASDEASMVTGICINVDGGLGI